MYRILSIIPFAILGCSEPETPRDAPEAEPESVPQEETRSEKSSKTEEVGFSVPTDRSLDSEASAALPEESPAWQTEIGAGESLVLLSRWSGSSVEDIGELNQMDVRDSLYPGQRIMLPLADDAQIEAFQNARARGQQNRLDRYLSSRGGLVDVDVHVIRTGETAWQVARDETGIPLWVLASFNQDTDLQHLGIGQPLQIPVLGDTVASLEFEEVDSIQMETVGLPIDFD